MEPATIKEYLCKHEGKVLQIVDLTGKWYLYGNRLVRVYKDSLNNTKHICSYLSAVRDGHMEFHMENGNYIVFQLCDNQINYSINGVNYQVHEREIFWVVPKSRKETL